MNSIAPSQIDNTDNYEIVLQIKPVLDMSTNEFFEFCHLNQNYRIERSAQGEIIIMPPVGGESGNRNFNLIVQLGNWTYEDGTGIGFDSSTGFKLPNGAERSPDASWMKLDKWNAIPFEQQQRFAPVCPDFVVEIRSPSDRLKTLQEKMQEYIDNGASLGWLIDRQNRKVYIYQPNLKVQCLDNPPLVSGSPILPGFVLAMDRIW